MDRRTLFLAGLFAFSVLLSVSIFGDFSAAVTQGQVKIPALSNDEQPSAWRDASSPAWTSGGPYGGPFYALAVSHSDSQRAFAGAYWRAGLYVTNNGGASWEQVDAGLGDLCTVNDVALASDDLTIYAGTHNGIFRSVDGGESWVAMENGLSYAADVWSIAVDPTDPEVVYAAVGERLYKTLDGAATLTEVFSATLGFWDVAVAPSAAEVVYAGTRGAGIYRSSDGGNTWIGVNEDLSDSAAQGELEVFNVAIHPADPDTVYIKLKDSGNDPIPSGVYQTTDGGVSWNATSLVGSSSGWGWGNIVIDEADPLTLYTTARYGFVEKTSDGGVTWTSAGSGIPDGRLGNLTIAPSDGRVLYGSQRFGVYRSSDGADSWQRRSEGLLGVSINAIAVDPINNDVVYAGTAGSGLQRSMNGGQSWEFMSSYPSMGAGLLAIAPDNALRLYDWGYRSTDGGASWSEMTGLPYGALAFAFDAVDSSVMFACDPHARILRTNDGGDTWDVVFGQPYEGTSDCSVVTDPSETGVVYVAFEGVLGGLWRSQDGGQSWIEVLHEPEIRTVAIDPFDSQTVYAGGWDLWRSIDGGDSWVEARNGYVFDFTLDPMKPGVLYGFVDWRICPDSPTSDSVAWSQDGGSSWNCIDSTGWPVDPYNLIDLETISFSPSTRMIYVGTRSISVWQHPSPVQGFPYSIFGHVLTEDGYSIPGVVVSAGPGVSATTNASGAYVFSDLITGTYTLTPSLSAWTFTPPTRTISVPPDATGLNFVGSMPRFSISGRVVDSFGTPISGITISDGVGHSTITDVSGDYTLSGLPEGTYTLVPGKLGWVFAPASLTVVVPPDAEEQDFTGRLRDVDIGFNPDPHGYRFRNTDPVAWGQWPLPPAIDDFTTADVRRMFGDDCVCHGIGPACLVRYAVLEWHAEVNRELSEIGHCLGMATTSLRLFQGVDSAPGSLTVYQDLEMGDPVLADWNWESYATTARRHISFFHVLQHPEEPGAEAIHLARQQTPSQVLESLAAAMSETASSPMVLGIWDASRTEAHALAPYAIQYRGDGVYWVWVYDSNWPGVGRYVEIDTAFADGSGSWSYDLGGKTWVGHAATQSLGAIPIDLFSEQPECLWEDEARTSDATPEGQVWFGGQGHLLISDAQDRRIGYVGEQYVNEISDAFGLVPMGGLGVPSEPIYYLPLTDTHRILIDGQTITQTKTVRVTQFGPGHAAWVSDVLLVPGTQDSLSITLDGTELAYQADVGKAVTLALALEDAAESRQARILGADVGSGEVVTVTADVELQTVAFSNQQASGGQYDFEFTRLSAGGRQVFYHADVAILATDTHYADYGAWDGLGPMTLHIDHGSDGDIDETIELENQAIRIYLPLVLRGS